VARPQAEPVRGILDWPNAPHRPRSARAPLPIGDGERGKNRGERNTLSPLPAPAGRGGEAAGRAGEGWQPSPMRPSPPSLRSGTSPHRRWGEGKPE
jgi:hypothetical protein